MDDRLDMLITELGFAYDETEVDLMNKFLGISPPVGPSMIQIRLFYRALCRKAKESQ